MITKELEKQIRTAISEVSTRVEGQVHTVAPRTTFKNELIHLIMILDWAMQPSSLKCVLICTLTDNKKQISNSNVMLDSQD